MTYITGGKDLLTLYFFTKTKLNIIINQPIFNIRRIRIKNMVNSPRTNDHS